MTNEEKVAVLEQYERSCNGTDKYTMYKQPWAMAYLTDGIVLMCETFQCYWLIDVILSYQTKEWKLKHPVAEHPVQYWTIKVAEDSSCEVYMDYIEGIHDIHQKIEFTDFPIKEKTIKYSAYDGIICLFAED